MKWRPIVIDSSVAIALILDEPEAPTVDRILRRWTQEARSMVVPSLFWLEVLNRLGRDPRPSGERMLAAIHRLDTIGLATVEPGRPLLLHAIDRVERYRLSVYDATYLVLAESIDADLATFDRELAAAAGPRAITFDETTDLHESPAPYEREVTWPNYKGASAYLAKLRSEALAEQA
jgi:predicted nucleic acid-binding protein